MPAVSTPRDYASGAVRTDGEVQCIRNGLSRDLLVERKRRGHVLEPEAFGFRGGHQEIWRAAVSGICAGAIEQRKDGCALGH